MKRENKKVKREKGFTLIELLAVIVILGLLLAIAIPSITKYINQSRRKTVVSSSDGYISSVVNDVNDQNYKFSSSNTIYAVPISCVSLEKGGDNPFGEWSPVSDDYWAYVLVQYNPEDFSYTYGFTFKDSAGYGMYPTSQDKIDPKKGSQVKTGLSLTKPVIGSYTSVAKKEDWLGFDINDSTKVDVLDETCSTDKSAKVESGTGNDIGNIISIENEKFYVIETTSTTVTMLAMNPITLDVNNPIQSESATSTSFANNQYWVTCSGNCFVKDEYQNGDVPYVYDSNSKFYQYVEAYETYLKGLGATSVDAKLIKYEQLTKLGCVYSNSGTCADSLYKRWLAPGYTWFTGSAIGTSGALHGITGDNFRGVYYVVGSVVRPIITISKSQIQF